MQQKYNSARVARNLKVIAELKSNNPKACTLKQYTGWGGLREAIYTPEIYRQLKQLLTQDEITSIKKTLTSAYYTPVELVKFIYQAITKLNRPFKRVLEPSIGHGVFIEHMPEAIKNNAEIVAIEIDSASCELVKRLYPTVKLHQLGFEAYQSNQPFDLIIGNPPYGRDSLQDEKHSDLAHLKIHHYFVAKCMRLLSDNGILAMVLPRYFLDNRRDHARAIIQNEGGSLLAAYRLPDDLFNDAKVTVDVVFLTKQKGAKDWLTVDTKLIDGKWVFISRYFNQNPNNVIGKLATIEAFGRSELTCRKASNNVFEVLNSHLSAFPPKKSASLHEIKCNIANRLNAISKEISKLMDERAKLEQAQHQIIAKEQVIAKQFTEAIPLF